MKKSLIIIFLLLLAIFFVNAFHEEYPDEYDSLVGGKYILEGKIPYRDWFQHHQPGAYVLAALILPFSGINFVKFRVILAAVFFLINIGGYLILKKRLPPEKINLNYYLWVLLAVAVCGTYFWWQMLLADTLAAYLLLPAYALIIFKSVTGDKFQTKDLLTTGLLTFFAWWTSMTYIYLVIGLNIMAIYLFLKNSTGKLPMKLWRVIKIMGTPYLIFFIYLLLSRSLGDYYFAAFTYNQNYYIYNAAHDVGRAVNPVRYAITIAMTFFNNFIPGFGFLTDFNPSNSVIPLLITSNLAIIIVLLISRKFLAAGFIVFSLIYANARSNPSAVRETDYQASVYTMFSLFNGLAGIYLLKNFINDPLNKLSGKIVAGFTFLILLAHSFYAYPFLSLNLMQKFYQKYMGLAPLIYNRPQAAPIVNLIAADQEYAWIGPFEFKDLFYLKTKKIPSKYHWFLQHAAASKIKDEMIADFEKNHAKVIVFNRNYSPFGGPASGFNYFFTAYLDKNYFRIFQVKNHGVSYKWKIGNTQNFDLDGDFNFDKTRKNEIIAELLNLNLIEKSNK